jgi:pyruvate dehydrogenase E2 component (dihydrolipoamide acetyltransferase)
MAMAFGMPSLGHTMEKGKIIEWLKQEGEAVAKGEPLVVIETDKVVTEVESPTDGVVLKITVGAEEERPIGALLALIGAPGEQVNTAEMQGLLGEESSTAASSAPASARPALAPQASVAVPAQERLKASPIARKLAQEQGVDLATVTATGPEGRITKDDVLQAIATPRMAPAAAAPPAAVPAAPTDERLKISPIARKLCEALALDPTTVSGTGPGGRITKDDVLRVAEARQAPAGATPAVSETPAASVTPAVATAPAATAGLSSSRTIPLRGIRGRVAERMFQSWNTIPRVTEVMQVDMNATVAFREAMQAQWEQQYALRISLNDMITRAVAVALRRHPRLNATLVDQEVRLHDSINIGLAVNLDEGLIVPVIRHTDHKDLGQIARESRALAEKARAVPMRLHPDEVSDGTFTITNLGPTGIDLFTPIINPPQIAILGVGMVQRRPVVVGDALAIRPSVYLCLVFDHRAVDGVPAANFLQEVKRLLEKPQDYAL